MAEWKPKSFQPSTFKEDVSGVESFGRGAKQGLTAGFGDELSGLASAVGTAWGRSGRRLLDGKLLPDSLEGEWDAVTNSYRKGRDEVRQADAAAEEANPLAYGVGQFGGAVATGLATGGASALGREGLKGALTAGALEGAAGGLGGSNADLTRADLDAYAKAFRDTTEGGIAGAGLGAGFYGAAKGLKWAGGKAMGALRGARGELEAGISAEREAADATARAAEEKAARDEAKRAAKEAMAAERAKLKQQKEFRAANERTQVDKRYADPNAPAPVRPGRAPPPSADEFQFTEDQLAGFRRQAQGAVAERLNKGRGFRADLENPDITTRRKAFAQDYLNNYDVSDPRAAADAEFRQNLAMNLGKRGYSADEIQRIVERYAPRAEPVTQAADLGDAFRQGRGPEVARQGGGGSAFGQDYPADARTVADVVPEGWDPSAPRSGDPFHDAPTRVGLIETSADGGYPGEGQNMLRDFEFRDPKSGRIVKMTTHRTPNYPEGVTVDGVGFKDQIDRGITYEDQWGEGANKVGPRVLKEVLGDLRRAYPGSEVVGGQRVTGIAPGRNAEVPMPEVTSPGSKTPWLPEPTQVMDTGDAVRQGRFDDLLSLGRAPTLDDLRGPAPVDMTVRPPSPPDPFHDAPTQVGLVDAGRVPHTPFRKFVFREPRSGRDIDIEAFSPPGEPDLIQINSVKFSDVPGDVSHEAAWTSDANQIGPRVLRQVFPDLAKAFPGAKRIGGFRATGITPGRDMEIRIPRSATSDAGENPALLRQRERGFGSQNMGAARYGDETIAYPNRDILRAQDAMGDVTQVGREPSVSGDDLRQWLDLTQEARGGAPESLPPLEDITSPGAPSFPSYVRRAQPFQAPPQLRPEYQPQPPPPRPVFDEALAERRAMGAQAQAGAGGMPTRNLRAAPPPQPRPAPAYDPSNSMVSPRDFDAETVVPLGDTQVPRAPRPAPYAGPTAPELAPEPVLANPLRQARPRPLAPPVAPPAQTTMGAPPGSLVRQARQSVAELAAQRERDALGDVVSSGWEGARSANNALAAPFGALYGIGKEALQNPAVRARAITAFRLDRLARVRPEVWARVGPTLQRAFQAGPERYKAERHVLLLRDPEFRAAEAEADAELEAADGQPPTRRAVGTR